MDPKLKRTRWWRRELDAGHEKANRVSPTVMSAAARKGGFRVQARSCPASSIT